MPGATRRPHRGLPLVVVLAVAGGGAACGSGTAATSTAPVSAGTSTCINRVTPDCSAYTYRSPRPGVVVVHAPTSGAINNREFFWSAGGPVATDQTVCATFATGNDLDQQGVVLRLNSQVGGTVSALTVTRNVWGGAFDVFNVHVWDTSAGPDNSFVLLGSTVVPTLPVAPAVYPLDLCARTVHTTETVQFVVWRPGHPRPDWGSTTAGGQEAIPAGAPASGRGGWFAGHLGPGTSMTYTGLTVDGTVADNLP